MGLPCPVLGEAGIKLLSRIDIAAADAIAKECGGKSFKFDVGDEASVVALFVDVQAAFGKLDALATPAGIADTTPFSELTVERWMQIYRVNVVGTWLCIREAVKYMKTGGRICTVASVAGKRGGGIRQYRGVLRQQRRSHRVDAQRRARLRTERHRDQRCMSGRHRYADGHASDADRRSPRALDRRTSYRPHRRSQRSRRSYRVAALAEIFLCIRRDVQVDGGVMMD